MEKPIGRPLPEINQVSRAYWEAARRHELVYQQCADCGYVQFPFQTLCRSCLGHNLEMRRSCGKGIVCTFSTVYRAAAEAFTADLPYTVAMIELAEGYRMLSSLVDISPSEVCIGLPVRVTFEDLDERCSLPKFGPDHNW